MKPKKHLGQNFLKNNDTLNLIVETANIISNDLIIEVGPGKGVLTKELVKRARQVIAIEKDHELLPWLRETFQYDSNIQLMQADVLQTEVPSEPYKVVANIPYYITSPILNHYLQSENPPQSLTLLVQYEVAQKICAPKGDHSVLSLQVHLFGQPTLIAKIPPTHFSPKPKVDSAILHITTYPESPYKNTQDILKIAKLAFSQKRKMLRNTLKTLNLDLSLLEKNSGINFNRRPEMLSLAEWSTLCDEITKLRKSHGSS